MHYLIFYSDKHHWNNDIDIFIDQSVYKTIRRQDELYNVDFDEGY